MIISTRDLSGLPDIETLRKRLQSIAMLNAILSSKYNLRPDFDFQANWAPGEQMANFDNMQGDNFFAVFTEAGCWLKGFAHESEMTPYRKDTPDVWPGMFRGMPTIFEKQLTEPAFESEVATTFCIWRLKTDVAWRRGNFELPKPIKAFNGVCEADLSDHLLSPLGNTPEQWAAWATESFEQYDTPVNTALVRELFDHRPLREELAIKISADSNLKKCRDAASNIGYPLGLGSFAFDQPKLI